MFNFGELAMKKSLIALAVLGLSSAAAMAQSSATLYGVADAGVGRIKSTDFTSAGVLGANLKGSSSPDNNGKTQFISGSLMNYRDSRLGVRGVEDLGGGLNVGFNFEAGLDLDDGGTTTGSNFWARQANMQIGGNWGTVKLGRMYTPTYVTMLTWELTGNANYSVLGNTYKYNGLGSRANSAFGYITPTFAGLTAVVGYVTKNDNVDASGTGHDVWDVALMYGNGPLAAGASVSKVKDYKTSYQIGGKYTFGDYFKLAASYSQASDAASGMNTIRRGFELGGTAMYGPFSLTLDVTRDTKNAWALDGKKYTNGIVEVEYKLSKRTFLYGAYLRVNGRNNYGLGIDHSF